jgi:hypothetical protein
MNNRSALRLMIAERGINGVLEDLGSVCHDIAGEKHNKDNNYGALWSERGDELIELGMNYNVGRRADRR